MQSRNKKITYSYLVLIDYFNFDITIFSCTFIHVQANKGQIPLRSYYIICLLSAGSYKRNKKQIILSAKWKELMTEQYEIMRIDVLLSAFVRSLLNSATSSILKIRRPRQLNKGNVAKAKTWGKVFPRLVSVCGRLRDGAMGGVGVRHFPTDWK